MKTFKSKLSAIIEEYLAFRKTLGYSAQHEIYLSMFDAYCCEHHPTVETLTKESVHGWVRYEITRGNIGMHKKVCAIRMLAKYIGNGAYVLPTKAVPRPPSTFAPYILTDDELTRLFNAADNMQNSQTQKSLHVLFPTLLRLMYTCGLRPYEVRFIKTTNINFDTGEILLEKTKRHKERIVVMSDDMLQQCRKYAVHRTISNIQSEYFFARGDNSLVPNQRLNFAFSHCWRQANSDIPTHMLPRLRPYDMRHRFATTVLHMWVNEKRDLYAMLPYLRAYMGHEMLSQTAYYIHLLPEHLLNSTGVDWSRIDSVNPEVDVWEN